MWINTLMDEQSCSISQTSRYTRNYLGGYDNKMSSSVSSTSLVSELDYLLSLLATCTKPVSEETYCLAVLHALFHLATKNINDTFLHKMP